MSLFIPRKQDILGQLFSKTTDAPYVKEAEKALRQNFLAIQNWANQRAVSASVSGSTNETLPNSAITNLSFDTKTWDYNTIASTSNQWLQVPEPGIYMVSAGVTFSAIPGQTHLLIAMTPGSYPQQDGFINGSTNDQWVSTFGGHVQNFKGGEHLKIYASATMPTSTETMQMKLTEFSLTKLFDKPSPVQ